MKSLLLAGASVTVFTLQAMAADLPPPEKVQEAVVAPDDWSGFYAGLNGGYGWQASGGDFELIIAGVPYTDPLEDLNAEGFFGGAQVGFNHQLDNVVIGIEADIQAADFSDEIEGNGNGAEIDDYTASLNVDWFGTLRGRAGVAFDRTLLYVTGGLAFGGVDWNIFTVSDAEETTDLSSDEIEIGFVVGAGVEQKFSDRWSVKAEYQYIDFGQLEASSEIIDSDDIPTGNFTTAEMDLSFHTVRIGLNYQF